jgi:hypothetical protein
VRGQLRHVTIAILLFAPAAAMPRHSQARRDVEHASLTPKSFVALFRFSLKNGGTA